jgi:dihydroorotate dehydrogenase
MLYSLTKPFLFAMDAEKAHHFALDNLKRVACTPLKHVIKQALPADPVDVMGITFPNRVGLAAGLDKNGDYIDALALLGFGSIEIGTITPRPQEGNPKPRLFRIKSAQGIINRMGFNNKGIDNLVEQVKRSQYKGVLGINIGKNKDTPNEKANDDYIICMQKAYEHATYITVNISSPNTPGLRDLQFGEPLNDLLAAVKNEQKKLADQFGVYKPVLFKIAPDMADDDLRAVADKFVEHQIDGIIATNTTNSRDTVVGLENADEVGGLSGAPVFEKSTMALKTLCEHLDGALPVIGVGGITNGEGAKTKIDAGASLVQIYSGFIYQGPQLIKDAGIAIAR